MKKERLILVSILMIGILSISLVSAGFIDWFKNLVGIDNEGDDLMGDLATLSGNETDNQTTNSTMTCYKDSDCGEPYPTNYCSEGYSCYGFYHPSCKNSGTSEAYCWTPMWAYCTFCTNGCLDGKCLLNQTCSPKWVCITGNKKYKAYLYSDCSLALEDYTYCPNGCQNGACVDEPSCIDNDGEDFFTKETCIDDAGIHIDECRNSIIAYDWFCPGGSSGDCARIGRDCIYFYGSDYVCQDGVCVIVGNETCNNTCSSLGYECGIHTICGLSTNCGTCSSEYECSVGSCILSQNETNQTTNTSSGSTSNGGGGGSSEGGGSSGGGSSGGGSSTSTTSTNTTTSTTSPLTFEGGDRRRTIILNVEKSKIIGENVEAISQVQLSELEGKVYASSGGGGGGGNRSVEVKITPDEVVETVKQETKSETIREIRVVEYKETIVYEVETEKGVKIIALIPTNMPIIIRLNLESGEIIDIKKPWWSFVAKEI